MIRFRYYKLSYRFKLYNNTHNLYLKYSNKILENKIAMIIFFINGIRIAKIVVKVSGRQRAQDLHGRHEGLYGKKDFPNLYFFGNVLTPLAHML